MKLFVIGATGYIGSVVARRLMQDGHELVGLARSDESAAQLAEAGISSVRGALGDTDIIFDAARNSDGVVQISTGGFLKQGLESSETLIATTDAIIEALAGTDKPYVITYGHAMWGDTGILEVERVVTEEDPPGWPYYYAHLGAIQRKLDAETRVRSIAIAPGAVYGLGGGYINMCSRLFDIVRRHGKMYAVRGSDSARSTVHVEDLADLYALAVKTPGARGTFIGASDIAKILDVATAVSIACGFGGEMTMVDHVTMRELNGRYAEFDFWSNIRASGQKARDVLGWRPHRPSLVDELKSLPTPLDLGSVYPQAKRQKAAAAAKAAAGAIAG